MYVCMYVYTYIYVYIHTYMYMLYLCIYVYIHNSVLYIYIYIYMCIYIYIYTYTHTALADARSRIRCSRTLVHEHGCHILPFQPILRNKYFPPEPAKQPRTALNLFQTEVEYGKYADSLFANPRSRGGEGPGVTSLAKVCSRTVQGPPCKQT